MVSFLSAYSSLLVFGHTSEILTVSCMHKVLALFPQILSFLCMPSKNLFIDNLPNMPRLKFLIVRIELCCLLGVKLLTAHKT
jgi:hypothetical protein